MYDRTALMVEAEAHHKVALVVAGSVPQNSRGLVPRLTHLTGGKKGSWHDSEPQKRVRDPSTER